MYPLAAPHPPNFRKHAYFIPTNPLSRGPSTGIIRPGTAHPSPADRSHHLSIPHDTINRGAQLLAPLAKL